MDTWIYDANTSRSGRRWFAHRASIQLCLRQSEQPDIGNRRFTDRMGRVIEYDYDDLEQQRLHPLVARCLYATHRVAIPVKDRVNVRPAGKLKWLVEVITQAIWGNYKEHLEHLPIVLIDTPVANLHSPRFQLLSYPQDVADKNCSAVFRRITTVDGEANSRTIAL